MSTTQGQGDRSPSSMSQASAVLEWDPSADVGTVQSSTPRRPSENNFKEDSQLGNLDGASKPTSDLQYSPISDSVRKLKSGGESEQETPSIEKETKKSGGSSRKSSLSITSEEPTYKLPHNTWQNEGITKSELEREQRKKSGSSASLISSSSIGYKNIGSTTEESSEYSSSYPSDIKQNKYTLAKFRKKQNAAKHPCTSRVSTDDFSLALGIEGHSCWRRALLKCKKEQLLLEMQQLTLLERALKNSERKETSKKRSSGSRKTAMVQTGNRTDSDRSARSRPSVELHVHDQQTRPANWKHNDKIAEQEPDSLRMVSKEKQQQWKRYYLMKCINEEISHDNITVPKLYVEVNQVEATSVEESKIGKERVRRKKHEHRGNHSSLVGRELSSSETSKEPDMSLGEQARLRRHNRKEKQRLISKAIQTSFNEIESEVVKVVDEQIMNQPSKKEPIQFFVNFNTEVENSEIKSVQEHFAERNPTAYSAVKNRDDALLEIKMERKKASNDFKEALDIKLKNDKDDLNQLIQQAIAKTVKGTNDKKPTRVVPLKEMLSRTENLLKEDLRLRKEKQMHEIMKKINYLRKISYTTHKDQSHQLIEWLLNLKVSRQSPPDSR